MADIFVAKDQKKKIKVKKRSISSKKHPIHKYSSPKGYKKIRKDRIDKMLSQLVSEKTIKNDSGSMSSFSYFPKNASFKGEDPEEEIVLLVRRHPITNVGWIFSVFLMSLFPIVISLLPFFVSLPSGFQIIFVLIWYMITIAYALEKFLGWFFNVNIITDERVIDVDFYNIVYRELSEAKIDEIQDVTVSVGGGLRTFLNYGDVRIQTAAEIPQFEFETVPNPDAVAQVLRELRTEEEIEKIEGRVR